MQLSSVYLYEKIKEKYEITERGTLSGSDGYLRPFLCYEKKETFRHGHVYVVQRYDKEWESAVLTAENILWVFCGREEIDAASEELQPVSYTHLRAHETDSYLVCRLLLEKKKKPKPTICLLYTSPNHEGLTSIYIRIMRKN